MPVQTYAEALVDALYDSLAADPRVSLIGSYVLGLGPQRHLMERVRKTFHDRIADPPTAEAGAAATGVGAAMAGVRPFVDLGTGSFPYLAWSQIVNEAAISYYMSDGRIPVPVTFHLLHELLGIESEVPAEKQPIPLGRAEIKRSGRDATIVANSFMTQVSIASAATLA